MKPVSPLSHRLLVDEPGLRLIQCLCCGEIELYFKGVAMALNLTDLYDLIARLDDLPTAPYYIVGLLDVRDTAVCAGFQCIGLHLTGGERDQLFQGLHLACLRLDMALLTQGQLPLN